MLDLLVQDSLGHNSRADAFLIQWLGQLMYTFPHIPFTSVLGKIKQYGTSVILIAP